MTTPLPVRRLQPGAPLPRQANPGDAGYDLHSAEAYDVRPGEREIFGTGIAVAIPEGHVGYIKPRSGLALRHGIDVLGGVIDAGYRGEVRVILLNTGRTGFRVNPGDRIAQLVIHPIITPPVIEVDAFADETLRGTNGFGSTGLSGHAVTGGIL